MKRFRVELIAATPNPQQCIFAAMHQDYFEGFVASDREQWPEEAKAGEICVKRLLAGERGHYGPLEHPQITLNVGWFPHSVMQQARTHRVGVSVDVQSMRYTGERISRAANGELELEEVFYLRPVGSYSDRQGKKYFMDLRAKLDAQQEIRELCDLMWPHFQTWAPEIAAWYEKTRLHKARLAP